VPYFSISYPAYYQPCDTHHFYCEQMLYKSQIGMEYARLALHMINAAVLPEPLLRERSSAPLSSRRWTSPTKHDSTHLDADRSCRSCHSPSIVVYHARGSAGLSNRSNVITALQALAGSLCASLAIPPPWQLLSLQHNYGRALNASVKWGRYFGGWDHLLNSDNPGSFPAVKRHIGPTAKQQIGPTTVAGQIRDAYARAANGSVPFRWDIHVDFWRWAHVPIIPPSCVRTLPSPSSSVLQVAMQVEAALGVTNGSALFTLHVRRGDVKTQCNTSAPAVLEYMQCELGRSTESSHDTLVLLTDETDQTWLDQVVAKLSKLPRWAGRVKHGDPLIVTQLPADLRSDNYMAYAVASMLMARSVRHYAMHRCMGTAPCPTSRGSALEDPGPYGARCANIASAFAGGAQCREARPKDPTSPRQLRAALNSTAAPCQGRKASGLLYNHVSKTGGTSVKSFVLSAVCQERRWLTGRTHWTGSEQIFRNSTPICVLQDDVHHMRVSAHDASIFYVLGSIRHPCDYYISYFSFVSEQKLRGKALGWDRAILGQTPPFSSPTDIGRFFLWMRALNDTYTRQRRGEVIWEWAAMPMAWQVANHYGSPDNVHCWMRTASLLDDAISCVEQYVATCGGAVERGYQDALASARDARSAHKTSHHASCDVYFDEKAQAEIMAREEAILKIHGFPPLATYGIHSCCSTSLRGSLRAPPKETVLQ